MWGTGIGAYASYTEIIKFSEKVGIGFGYYAVARHSILSDYFLLAAFQKKSGLTSAPGTNQSPRTEAKICYPVRQSMRLR